MEEALTALLADVAGGERYWVRAPQGTAAPYVVLNGITGNRDYNSQGPSGYVESRVQIDCYGETYGSAKTTARAVRSALSGVRSGALLGVFIDSERDFPAADAEEVNRMFRVSIDIIVHHQET
ncbi:hypothetical protein A7A08_01707 [Methyloligella halotolerans]|uniref:DUF3168 domain-containing protein n=1 Tax=Methyloligella halotolerans TaxID=1177755 RepID=A0A1E2RZT7_9HYPH|nr:DUF3168 domain-containing protein [Methyloligella halotolerans]ODA67672.1 hypothetical protein A7A08_01707 [Methyloligella halotolerans]